jgi:hypothetical protein
VFCFVIGKKFGLDCTMDCSASVVSSRIIYVSYPMIETPYEKETVKSGTKRIIKKR